MKTSRSTVILALCTLLIGALLIAFPTHATKWLIMAIGALFLGPGLYTVGTYILQRRRKPNNIAKQNDKSSKDDKDNGDPGEKTPDEGDKDDKDTGEKDDKEDKESKVASFPFIGIGSILFGSVLLIIPSSFLNALLYLLGAFLLLAGAAQLYRLIKLRKHYKLGALPYVVSSLISIAGIVIIILNYNTATDKAGQEPITSYIFGVASIIFGLSEIIYAIQFRNSGKDPEDGEEDSPEEGDPQEEEDEFGWDTEYYSTEDPTGEETWDDSDRVEEPLEPEAEVLPEGGSGWEEEFSEETDGTEGGEESTPGLSAEEILESTMSSFMLTRDFAPQSVSSLEGTLYTTMEDIDYDGQTELVVISMHSGRMSFTVYESDGTQAYVSCEESADSCAFGDDFPESYKGTQTAFRKGNCIGVATYQLGTTQDGGSSGIFAAVMMWSIDASGSASRVLNAAWNAGMDPQDFMNQLAGQGLSGDWILSGAGLDFTNQPDLIYSAENPLENGFHNVESAVDYDYVTVNASGSVDYADVRVN